RRAGAVRAVDVEVAVEGRRLRGGRGHRLHAERRDRRRGHGEDPHAESAPHAFAFPPPAVGSGKSFNYSHTSTSKVVDSHQLSHCYRIAQEIEWMLCHAAQAI